MKLLAVFLGFYFLGAAVAAELPGNSIYQLKTDWTDQNGNKIKLDKLSGAPVIVSMVYLSCHFTCPTVVKEVNEVTKALDAEAKKKVKVLLVSFDPKNDTPAAMLAFMKERSIPNDGSWTFITNKDDKKIRELAATLDFKYKKDADGEFTHSYFIGALSPQGVLEAKVSNMGASKKELLEKLK